MARTVSKEEDHAGNALIATIQMTTVQTIQECMRLVGHDTPGYGALSEYLYSSHEVLIRLQRENVWAPPWLRLENEPFWSFQQHGIDYQFWLAQILGSRWVWLCAVSWEGHSEASISTDTFSTRDEAEDSAQSSLKYSSSGFPLRSTHWKFAGVSS